MFRQSANANGSAESRSALGSLYSRQHHSQNAPRLLCDVFLDFRSRSARSRSATFKRSSARQSARRLPHRALCALRRITAYLHKPHRKPVRVMRGKISRCFCLRRSVAGVSWVLLTACVSVPSFLCGKCFAWGGSGAAHVVGVRFVCGRGAERPFRGGFERKTSEKTRVRALSGDVTGRGVQFKSKKKQFMRDAFTSRC